MDIGSSEHVEREIIIIIFAVSRIEHVRRWVKEFTVEAMVVEVAEEEVVVVELEGMDGKEGMVGIKVVVNVKYWSVGCYN